MNTANIDTVRALVSKGWGNVGGNKPPKSVHLLGNVPHDWLFPRVSAVVHHGGAGTTAIGIALGKPTVIVPFFGDQSFWANMVYKAGAGPEPVPFKEMTSDILANHIKEALSPEVKEKAHKLAEQIKGEEGPKNAAEFFHHTPQMRNVGCFLLKDRVAVWRIRRTNIQLSSLAASILVTNNLLKSEHLKLVRHKRWYVEEGSQDPLMGIVGAFTSTATGLVTDIEDLSKGLSRKKNAGEESDIKPREKDEKTKAKGQKKEIDRQNKDAVGKKAKGEEQGADTEDKKAKNRPRSASTSSAIASRPATDVKDFVPPRKSDTFAENDRKARGEKGPMSAIGTFAESSAVHVAKRKSPFPMPSDLALTNPQTVPGTLLYNLANGFHNVSGELGDQTVRMREPITGLGSGLKVGGQEFVYGLYDAVTGVVTQPIAGYQEGKNHTGGPMMGLAKGMGLGLVGLVTKTPAAIIGPFGYGSKGLEREVQKWRSGSNALQGNEVDMMMKAKEEVRNSGMGTGDGKHATQLMWHEARGAGVGQRIVERRVWQGYRELREMRNGDEGKKIEETVLAGWKTLNVEEHFLKSLLS